MPTGCSQRASAGLAVGLVLAAVRAVLLQFHPVRVVTPVLARDVVAVLALLAGQGDLGPHVGGSHSGVPFSRNGACGSGPSNIQPHPAAESSAACAFLQRPQPQPARGSISCNTPAAALPGGSRGLPPGQPLANPPAASCRGFQGVAPLD